MKIHKKSGGGRRGGGGSGGQGGCERNVGGRVDVGDVNQE